MAVIWERNDGTVLYEVRQAGNTLRLYRDGVLHTQYNPSRPLTLGVWDLLLLPAFGLVEAPRRALVLGVGGGAILRLLQDFFPGIELTGVDLDAQHLKLATRFFGVERKHTKLVKSDARSWLEQAPQTLQFDLVVDDIFVGKGACPLRAFDADAAWFDLLLSRLAPGGALVMNFPAMSGLSKAAWTISRSLRRRLPCAMALMMPHYANAVGAFYESSLEPNTLRARLLANEVIARELRSGRFNVSVRSLRPRR